MATGRQTGPRLRFPGSVSLALTPDGRSLAVGGADGTVWLQDSTGVGPAQSFQAGTSAIWSLGFSDDGRMLASSTKNGRTARVWETSTGRLLAEVDCRTYLQTVALSPGGRSLATAGWDGVVRLWDVATGRPFRISGRHRGAVTCMAFAPHGAVLACGGVGSIRWYLATRPAKLGPDRQQGQ